MRHRFLRRAGAGSAFVALLAACDGGTDEWRGSVSTLPGGARLVENPAEGLWAQGSEWFVEEDLRIGRSDGDGPDVFSVVFAYDVAADGSIYVFDALSRELRVFGGDGSFVRAFGRKGGGPGEFEGVIGVRVPEPGTVWLVDLQNSRYTVVRGDSFASFPRPAGMYRPPWIGGFTADGIFHDLSAIRDGEVFVRVSDDGVVRDTVALPYPELNLPRRGSTTFELPLGPRHLRAFDENGYIWTAQTHDYRLHRISLTGDTVLVVTHPQQPQPLSQQQRDSVANYARMLEQEVRVTFDADMLPRTAPILDWLAVDEAGHVWAGLAGDEGEPTRADVFEDDGRYLGRVTLPIRGLPALPPRFRNGRLHLVGHDELGTPIVFRGSIKRWPQ